ncbi:Phage protein [Enterococcus phage Q69]|nr:Phage protein [Enterococcus phage Q69]
MKYTENDLKDGMKLICTQDGGFDWWTKGGIYTVANKCILDNFGDSVESWYILDTLNNECSFVKFEIFEYPTATITVDVEQRLNDKIEALSVERQNIFDKMERMDRQEVKLRDKINKLKEAKKALEILKEFK